MNFCIKITVTVWLTWNNLDSPFKSEGISLQFLPNWRGDFYAKSLSVYISLRITETKREWSDSSKDPDRRGAGYIGNAVALSRKVFISPR